MRLGDLEYRNISFPEIVLWYPNPHYGNEDKYIMSEDGNWYSYPDNPHCSIHKSGFANPESCITITLFRRNKDGDYYVEFVGDRPLDDKVAWNDFRTLLQIGYNELNNCEEYEEI